MIKIKKDSIVYFQANDDLDNNPHNFYDRTVDNPLNTNNGQIYKTNYDNSASSQEQELLAPSHQIISQNWNPPNHEPIIGLHFNSKNNTISTQPLYLSTNSTSTYNNPLNHHIIQNKALLNSNNCHTNQALYYDYTTSFATKLNSDRSVVTSSSSSKYSFPANSLQP